MLQTLSLTLGTDDHSPLSAPPDLPLVVAPGALMYLRRYRFIS